MFGLLKGYKTFIVAALAVLGAVLGYLTGTLTAVQAAQLIIPAVLGGTLRDALNSTVGRAIERAVVELLETSLNDAAQQLVPVAPAAVQTVAPPQPVVPVPSPTPLNDAAQQLAPVAVDVIAAVKAIIAASEGKGPTPAS